MELTCSRCHQTVQDENCFCPNCGLPQLVYSGENTTDTVQRERWGQVVRDANTVGWNSALRSTLPLAIPAGVLCSMLSPLGIFGLLLMGAAAAWAVKLYTRRQRPAWVTVGAGARIGCVAGVIAGWTAAVISGLSLYGLRFWLHQGSMIDSFWQSFTSEQMAQGAAIGADAQTLASIKAIILSPEGRAGFALCVTAFLIVTVMLFAVAGGALGARMLMRARRPEN